MSTSTTTRIKLFFFFLCLRLCLRLCCNKFALSHNTSTRIFTTRGYVWPIKTLDPDYLALKQLVLTLVLASPVVTKLKKRTIPQFSQNWKQTYVADPVLRKTCASKSKSWLVLVFLLIGWSWQSGTSSFNQLLKVVVLNQSKCELLLTFKF